MVDAIINEVENSPYGSVWGSREVWDARRRSAYRVLCERAAPVDDEFVRISGKSAALKPLMKLYEIHSLRYRTDSKLAWFPSGEEISF